MDCDGVLTDGRLYFSRDGEAMKVFNVRDGQGIVLWRQAGFRLGIISGRGAENIIRARTDELGIDYVRTSVAHKIAAVNEIVFDAGVRLDETAYIGDDVGDINAMKAVGFPVAVADAVDQVKAVASYITKAKGGDGAVREVIDLLLSKQ